LKRKEGKKRNKNEGRETDGEKGYNKTVSLTAGIENRRGESGWVKKQREERALCAFASVGSIIIIMDALGRGIHQTT
jgi:hypothetical protein